MRVIAVPTSHRELVGRILGRSRRDIVQLLQARRNCTIGALRGRLARKNRGMDCALLQRTEALDFLREAGGISSASAAEVRTDVTTYDVVG